MRQRGPVVRGSPDPAPRDCLVRTPMKTNTLFLAVVALAVGASMPAARSQDYGDAALNRMASWVSNAATAIGGPSCGDPAGDMPWNYAEDTCCGDGCCGCCSSCCHRHDVWATTEFLMWW